MILRQFLHVDPVAASYLFGCGGKASAAVVDPLGDVAPYLRVAEATGMRIRYVIDTHLHADHRVRRPYAGSKPPAPSTCCSRRRTPTFRFRGVRDRELLGLGNVTVKVLHTSRTHPGAYLAARHRSDPRPTSPGSYSPATR